MAYVCGREVSEEEVRLRECCGKVMLVKEVVLIVAGGSGVGV